MLQGLLIREREREGRGGGVARLIVVELKYVLLMPMMS